MRKVRYLAAKTEAFPEDTVQVVPLGDDGGACGLAFHKGRWFAFGSLCPHQNASLHNAPIQNGEIICLRHGYRFCPRSGDCLTLGGYGLPIFETIVEEGMVYVLVWDYGS